MRPEEIIRKALAQIESMPLSEASLLKLNELMNSAEYRLYVKNYQPFMHQKIFQPIKITSQKSVEQWLVEHPTDKRGLTLL